MFAKSGRNRWILFLLLLAGMVLGGFIGYYLGSYSFLSWLNYGQAFGLETPVTLSLGIITITFGLLIKINIASLIGMVLSVLIYKFSNRF